MLFYTFSGFSDLLYLSESRKLNPLISIEDFISSKKLLGFSKLCIYNLLYTCIIQYVVYIIIKIQTHFCKIYY